MPFVDFTAAEVAPPVRAALGRYDDTLLRVVANKFTRPRLQNAPDDLRERVLDALTDPVSVDRAIRPLSASAKRLLRGVGISRQPYWRVQALVDLLRALGDDSGVEPVLELLDAGLIYPDLPPSRARALGHFDEWVASAAVQPLGVHVVALAAQRARGEDLGLPELPHTALPTAAVLEADGLEWPMRLAVAWQVVRAGPIRRTQQGGFFKRDYDRLHSHPLLATEPAEQVAPVVDPALFAVELALVEGILAEDEEQIRAGELPAIWAEGVGPACLSLLVALTRIHGWDPIAGWTGESTPGRSPVADVVLALALLARIPQGDWVKLDDLDGWLAGQPDGRAGVIAALAGGILHQLRLVQAAKHGGESHVRLSPFGRAVVEGAKSPAVAAPAVEQTLLVQPNLEIVLFRQGLTPALVARLSRFAEWKSLGLACTLTLTADSVYRGLESGESLNGIVALLERHGTRAVSETVLGSLRSWASKRDRVRVYPSALLLEFRNEAELDRAVRQGLIEHKVSDRVGLIASEAGIDYRQFRLAGTRDYLAPEEVCVAVGDDGLTLTVNEHKSDLLLESELARFADPASGPADERTRYRMTPASLRRAKARGLDASGLDDWFVRRTGEPLPPAAKLLLDGDAMPPVAVERLVVLRVTDEAVADGLLTWPETRGLIAERLSPTVLAVQADTLDRLRATLAEIGVTLIDG